MTDYSDSSLTIDEKLKRCQGSFNAMFLGLIAYFKDQQLPLDKFVAYMVRHLSDGWNESMTALEYLTEAGNFSISLGCELIAMSGDAEHAEATFASWPPDADWTTDGFLSFWKLGQDEVGAIWDIDQGVAEHLGLKYQWHRQGDHVKVTVDR